MTVVHARLIGEEAVLPRLELDQIVAIARQSEEIRIEILQDTLPATGIMQLAEKGGAFDWLADEKESYTVHDLKVRYR